jgi:hypothetical protein
MQTRRHGEFFLGVPDKTKHEETKDTKGHEEFTTGSSIFEARSGMMRKCQDHVVVGDA